MGTETTDVVYENKLQQMLELAYSMRGDFDWTRQVEQPSDTTKLATQAVQQAQADATPDAPDAIAPEESTAQKDSTTAFLIEKLRADISDKIDDITQTLLAGGLNATASAKLTQALALLDKFRNSSDPKALQKAVDAAIDAISEAANGADVGDGEMTLEKKVELLNKMYEAAEKSNKAAAEYIETVNDIRRENPNLLSKEGWAIHDDWAEKAGKRQEEQEARKKAQKEEMDKAKTEDERRAIINKYIQLQAEADERAKKEDEAYREMMEHEKARIEKEGTEQEKRAFHDMEEAHKKYEVASKDRNEKPPETNALLAELEADKKAERANIDALENQAKASAKKEDIVFNQLLSEEVKRTTTGPKEKITPAAALKEDLVLRQMLEDEAKHAKPASKENKTPTAPKEDLVLRQMLEDEAKHAANGKVTPFQTKAGFFEAQAKTLEFIPTDTQKTETTVAQTNAQENGDKAKSSDKKLLAVTGKNHSKATASDGLHMEEEVLGELAPTGGKGAKIVKTMKAQTHIG